MSELLQIFVFRDGAYVGNEVYTDPEVLIGRADGVDLVLDDDLVSPRHAIVKQEASGQIRLTRLGSLPLRVNRKDVTSAFISSRDEIQIGEHTLKVKILEKRPSALPSSPSNPSIPGRGPSGGSGELYARASVSDEFSKTEVLTEVATVAINVSDSSVVETRLIDAGAMPPRRARVQVDAAWDETALSGDNHASIEHALDSAFEFDSPFEPPVEAPIESPIQAPPRASQQADTARIVRKQHSESPEPVPHPPGMKPSLVPDMLRPDPRETVKNGAAAAPQIPERSISSSTYGDPHEPIALVVDDEEMDEEEIDAWTRPGFSLLRTVVQQAAPASRPTRTSALEVLAFTGDAVRQAALLAKVGERYVLGTRNHGFVAPPAGYPGLKLAKLTAAGSAELTFPSSAEGVVMEGGTKRVLDDLKRRENAVSKTGDIFRYTLREGSNATLKCGDTTFHVRFVRPPMIVEAAPPPFDWAVVRAIGAAIVTHMLVLILVAVLRPSVVYSDAPREVWSDPQKNEVREVEIKEPPPPEPEPIAEVKEPEPIPEPEPEPQPKKKTREPKEAGGGKEAKVPKGVPKQEIKSAGVLGAMGKLNLAAPGKKSIVQAVSNIDAVRAPGGSNFRVGALVGKLPASEVSVGGGGGGGLLTRGGASLLRGGDGLAQLGKRGGGKVRGQVTKVTARNVEAKGSISREEVAQVINQHLREVQYCYEKTLLKDPGLAGKLILEWVIDTEGGVGRVKEKLSTLRNPEVSSCISSSLKRWTFPKPRGGIVIVSYPFIFNAVGF